jgi:hypothetical protein
MFRMSPRRTAGRFIGLGLALGMAFLPASASTSVGIDLVVAPNGDDGNPGTAMAPLKTLSAAARLAKAGTTVRIRAGLYAEDVRVTGQGTREAPIVFEAEQPGTVIVTGAESGFAPQTWAGDDDDHLRSGNRWVTLRGLVFRHIGERPAVRASTGWRIEGCRFEQSGFGVNIRGNDVAITRSVFQDLDSPRAHAITAYGSRGLRLSELVIRRINTKKLIRDVANSAVLKILSTDGLIIEDVVSEGNVGPGLWLDSGNRNFVIRRNILRANSGSQAGWEGPGLWLENNVGARGDVYGNLIVGNSGAGIEVMESSDIRIHDNVILDNPACFGLRNLPRGDGGTTLLDDIRIEHNLCGGWTSMAVGTGPGEWQGWDAAAHRIVIDGGRYLRSNDRPLFVWNETAASNPQEAAEKLGFERTGILQ